MNYQLPVYSQEELSKATDFPPLEPGIYKFKVLERTQGVSKNNSPQEKLVLEVYHRKNQTMKCYHNFTFHEVGEPAHMFLINLAKKFLDCIGVEYKPDAFNHIVGKTGEAEFLVDVYKKDGEKREKFKIANNGFDKKTIKNEKPNEELNDEIPW
ncbi:MAG: hypothetical protein ACYTFQ_27620 [Planctomycetota bacterium]|jgi:hypothetical protein